MIIDFTALFLPLFLFAGLAAGVFLALLLVGAES